MERFFGHPSTQWDSLTDRLHVYAVPGQETSLARAVCEAKKSLASFCEGDAPCLAYQPQEYLHATVQQFGMGWASLDLSARQTLTGALADRLRAVEPFSLEFAAPVVKRYAVETIAEPCGEWTALHKGVAQAVVSAGLGDDLPEPPFGPHMTLAYGIASHDGERIDRALSRGGFPARWTVDGVWLVRVWQDRDRGIFGFDKLGFCALGGRQSAVGL